MSILWVDSLSELYYIFSFKKLYILVSEANTLYKYQESKQPLGMSFLSEC